METQNGLLTYMIKKRNNVAAANKTNKKCDNYKHSASIITGKGRVLSIGSNYYHPGIKNGFTIHAEVDTIQKASRPMMLKHKRSLNKRRIPADIYVIRTTMVNSHPCFHCINTMKANPVFNIKRVYYSIDGGLDYISMSALLNKDNYISRGNRRGCCAMDLEGYDEEDEEQEGKCVFVVV